MNGRSGMLKHLSKIGMVGCSNGRPKSYETKILELEVTLKEIGLVPLFSDYIFQAYSVYSGTGEERAKALMKFYMDKEIDAIFDISGGDLANEILGYLDFNIIKENPKPFFGYSDLTTVVNAIYAKTSQFTYLYQLSNLIYDQKEKQISDFKNTLMNGNDDLFDFQYEYIQGNQMSGILVGGNIRCLLKLAGTPYMPDFKRKILFLEANSGDVPKMVTYLNQLKQMGVFQEVRGVLLGTFTEMEDKQFTPSIEELAIDVIGDLKKPVAKTKEIGHGTDSKCLIIGKEMKL